VVHEQHIERQRVVIVEEAAGFPCSI